MTLHGFPAAMHQSGMSFVTSPPAELHDHLDIPRPGKLVDRNCPLYLVPAIQQYLQVPYKACRLTAYVYDPLYIVVNDLGERLGMDPVTRRIKHDKIRFLVDLIEHLEHIPRDELTIVKSV